MNLKSSSIKKRKFKNGLAMAKTNTSEKSQKKN